MSFATASNNALAPLTAPPNVGNMTQEQQAEFINQPSNWVFRAKVQGVRLAYSVMSTPFAVAAINTIMDGVLSGQPAFRLERDEGMRPTPEFEDLLNKVYSPFSREALLQKFALGFTAIKIHPDYNTGFKTPIIPAIEDCEFHVIQNRVTGATDLCLFDLRNAKYDEAVNFIIDVMPTVEGRLRSSAASLFDIFQMMTTKLNTSNALDRRAALGEAWIRKRIIDDNKASSQIAASQMAVFDIQQGSEPLQSRTTRQQLQDMERTEEKAPVEVQSFIVPSLTGPRAINQLGPETEFVNTYTSNRQGDDLAKAQELYKTALISVLGLPVSLFNKDAVVHGKGLEEVDEQANEVIEGYARQVQDFVQTAYDLSYAIEDEKVLRQQLQNFFEMQKSRAKLDQLRQLLTVQRQVIELRRQGRDAEAIMLFPGTSQQLIDTHFVTDEEYADMVRKQRVRVVVSYNIRVSVMRIYDLVERGTIDEDTGHDMVIRALKLDGGALDVSHQTRLDSTKQKKQTNGQRTSVRNTMGSRSTQSRNRERAVKTQRQNRRIRQKDRRDRRSDTDSRPDTR